MINVTSHLLLMLLGYQGKKNMKTLHSLLLLLYHNISNVIIILYWSHFMLGRLNYYVIT